MGVLKALLCAVGFLTRIPVPCQEPLSPRVAGFSVAFFPLVGLLLGAAQAGAAWLLRDRLGVPPHLLWALLLVALHAFLTGALHLDGLSDVVDGLGGGRGDRERALEIMKDPRVGAFGVVALILTLVAKVVLMDEVLRLKRPLPVLLAYPVAPRFAATLMIALFPCARPTGLARLFHDHCGWTAVLVAAIVAGGAIWMLGHAGFAPAGVALVVALGFGLWVAARLRGLTGDAYGAAIELAELASLFTAAMPRIWGG